MTTAKPQRAEAARRGPRSSRGSGRFVRAGISLLVVGVVLSTVGGSAGPSSEVPAFARLAPGTAPASLVAVAVRPVSYWEGRFVEGWDYERKTALPASNSADSWDHYALAYDVDANTAMFRATGDRRYLDRALEYVENVVATARQSSSLATSQCRDRYRGWVSFAAGLDPSGVEVPLYESYFWRYATTLLRVIGRTPRLRSNPGYRAQYARLLEFTEVQVFEKWYRRGVDETIYRSRTHMAAHWAAIALNLSLVTSDPVRLATYRTVVDHIDGQLRGQLRDSPVARGAYFWSDEWGSADRPGQDVGHGNGVIAYLVEACRFGTTWTAGDMERFAATLTAVVWPHGRSYHRYVDGTGTDNGWFADGFVKLGRYSATAQRRLEHHEVVNHQFVANMALNAHILSGEPPYEN
jgi:hypothetical protein